MAGRALVLGGGGITGIAWEVGLLAGLAAEGIDLSAADLVVGTSAGSLVGAHVAWVASGESFEGLYAAQLANFGVETAAEMGQLALGARTVPPEQRLAVIADRLPSADWPERALRITAVDADSGEFLAFDRCSGVTLVEAVTASCAVPGVYPPIPIGPRRYVDGGVRSATNADLADGHERIVILAPVTSGYGPLIPVKTFVEQLRPRARVVSISPDAGAAAAIGPNVLNPARRAQSATAGRVQGRAAAGAVRAVWG